VIIDIKIFIKNFKTYDRESGRHLLRLIIHTHPSTCKTAHGDIWAYLSILREITAMYGEKPMTVYINIIAFVRQLFKDVCAF
jgi:hypothetical protein